MTAQLATYVGTTTTAVASAIEPAAVTLATIYIMMWGYLSLTGKIQEPVLEGAKRIFVMVLILGIGVRLWTYNTVIVDTFFNAPTQLAASIVGSGSPVGIIDTIWDRGGTVGGFLWNKGGVLSGDVGFYLAGAVVWVVIGLVAIYALFLLALSKFALSIILALGPIFIVLLFFDSTKRFFESWIAQLANYGLIAILASLVAALMLQLVSSYATQTAALGAAIVTVDALNMILCAALVFLLMRQVMPIAAGLASGIALSSFGAVSGVMNWGLSSAKRSAYDFGRGVMDGMHGDPRSRWDSLRRSAGNRLGTGARALWNRLRDEQAGGTIRRRDEVIPRRDRAKP